jgi:triacylglycerol lipase
VSEATTASIEAELRHLGPRFDPQILGRTRELYRTAVAAMPWADRAGVFDLSYGPAERHRLDLYPSDRPGAPVLLFLHGGGFVGGDKRSDETFYGNVGRYFATNGFLTLVANYRLAPMSMWPSGQDDVAAIRRWIDDHAAQYGGDPARVVIVGQSAGAAHAASYVFDPRSEGRRDSSIRAVALLSGFYRAKPPMPDGPRFYFGDDQSAWADRSPAAHVTVTHPPLLLTVAEFDPAPIADQTLDLATALNAADGRAPQLIWFAGHNHVSTVHSVGIGSDTVGRALCEFAKRHVD